MSLDMVAPDYGQGTLYASHTLRVHPNTHCCFPWDRNPSLTCWLVDFRMHFVVPFTYGSNRATLLETLRSLPHPYGPVASLYVPTPHLLLSALRRHQTVQPSVLPHPSSAGPA